MLDPRATDSRLRRRNASGVPFAGRATGVGQAVNSTVPGNFKTGLSWPPAEYAYLLPEASFTTGVGQPICAPVCSVATVRRPDARSREYRRPEGVAASFQIRRYKVEPSPTSRAFNLFPKHDVRATLADEPVEGGPKVPLVSKPASFACRAERLTGAAPGPDGLLVRNSGETQSKGPPAEPGEEMTLPELTEIVGVDVNDGSLVNVAGGDVTGGDEIAEPLSGVGFELIIVGPFHSLHRSAAKARNTCWSSFPIE